jgi:hypothetical protein
MTGPEVYPELGGRRDEGLVLMPVSFDHLEISQGCFLVVGFDSWYLMELVEPGRARSICVGPRAGLEVEGRFRQFRHCVDEELEN